MILTGVWAAALAAAGFTVLVWIDQARAAAVVLALVPVTLFWTHVTSVGRYLDRHLGGGLFAHLLVAVWGSGMAVVSAGYQHVTVVALASGIAALASATIVISAILSTRFPVELAARDFPGEQRIGERGEPALPLAAAAATMVIATAVVAAGGTASSEVALLTVSAMVYGASVAMALGTVFRRVRGGADSLRTRVGSVVAGFRPEIIVHFSGAMRTLYQLDQWVPHIASSGRRVILVARERETFESARWGVPTVFVKDFPDLDLVVTPATRVCLYVNTSTKNNQLVRFASLTHAQLHHGESDKPPSSSKTMRLYDHHFVAGEAAYERLTEAGIVDGPDSVSVVGRPQTDDLVAGPLGHQRATVLYAPTWEGYHLDTALSSLSVAGTGIVDVLAGRVDLVVRPHPLTGTVDGRLRSVVARLRESVTSSGGRFVDPGDEPIIESLNGADVLITDVSSVLVDFLAADRPAIVLDVTGLGEERFRVAYPSTSWAHVVSSDLAGLEAAVADAIGPDTFAGRRAQARARLLSYVGNASQRFVDALDSLVESAEPSHQSAER